MEGLGGYLNAFTTEDHTCYYAKAAAPHLPELCDVLGDMYLESQFAPGEIEKEREVIREEILMYRDHPAQHAQELLTATMWPGHPLGRPLTGTVETIARLRAANFVGFRNRHYTGSTTIITVAGPVNHERVVDLLTPFLGGCPRDARRVSCARGQGRPGEGVAFYAGNRADASGNGLSCLWAHRRTALRPQAALASFWART